MFDREARYPTAVASYDDEGVAAAIDWCVEHMEDGDTISVWTSLKSNLENCPALQVLRPAIPRRRAHHRSWQWRAIRAWTRTHGVGRHGRHR